MIDRSLIAGVELLSLDAGNTVIFLDHARLASIANEAGFSNVSRDRLVVTEGETKRLLDQPSRLIDPQWRERGEPGAAGWGRMAATMLALAGVDEGSLSEFMSVVWKHHVEFNLWSVVPDGFKQAMAAIRARGIKTAIVSNSEGMLDRLFEKLGIHDCFDALVDSGKVGHEKPGARIFEIACERTGKRADVALHLGDTVATDIVGGRAAKMRVALIDPYKHYEGLFLDVPRVPGAVEVATALLSS